MPVQSVAGKEITTLEGLGAESSPHPLQAAFIELQALQCGYCASGIITTAAAFLEKSPSPTDDEIKQALSGHLCRCGAQPRMVKGVSRAASSCKPREPWPSFLRFRPVEKVEILCPVAPPFLETDWLLKHQATSG
jgi:nicotinate dehydrogenase subunit A